MTTHSRTRRQLLTGRSAGHFCLSAVGLLAPITALCQVSPEPASNDEALSEIVVTARKFEERVQDIPMSVQVLSAQFLDEADVTRLFDLQFNVPGLVVNNLGLFGAGFSLRGLGDQGGNEQTVASHLNGVYLGNANLAIARLFDLERIEVLKGPQGTLYGRNATGGSMNFITRSAHDEFSADIETAYGSFSTVRAQGHVNLPFEKSALRVAFIGSEGDGYVRNSVDNRQFGENDFWGLRGSLLFNLSDKLSLDLIAQKISDDGASGELWSPNPQYLVNPEDVRLTTVTLADPYLRTDTDVVSANLEYEFGFAHFRSITGYASSNVGDRDDCAGEPRLQGCVRGTISSRHEQWSQEFQLASGDEAHIAWLLGANYFSVDTAMDWYLFVPLANPIPLRDLFGTTEETAIAVFGQAIVPITDRWSLTGGLRFSNEKQSVTSIGAGVQDSLTLKTAEEDWNNFSWRIDLEFRPADNMLLYASVATGFKSGGYTIFVLSNSDLDDFDSEDLIAYEAGIKSQWLDRRLTFNSAAFFYDYEDLQVATLTFVDNQLISQVDNAAKAEIYGLDTDVQLQLSERLSLSGGVVWVPKREFVEFIDDRPIDTISGNKLRRAPEWTSTAAISYEMPFHNIGRFSSRVEYNYRSGFFFSKENTEAYSQDHFGLLNVRLNFESMIEKWYVFASARNLANQDYFTTVLFQSSPGYPDTYELGFGYRF